MTESQIVQISTEQLGKLIEEVRLSATTNNGSANVNNFDDCGIRFWGDVDYEYVERFILHVMAYKEFYKISDEDALKSISLLFIGESAILWQGIRNEVKTWNEVFPLIRKHFLPPKPAYQLYMDIFGEKQDNEKNMETFIKEKRKLFAQFSNGRFNEETQLDMIYGLLHVKYRRHIPRAEVKTFLELLEKGVIVEYNTEKDTKEKKTADAGNQHKNMCTKHCPRCVELSNPEDNE